MKGKERNKKENQKRKKKAYCELRDNMDTLWQSI